MPTGGRLEVDFHMLLQTHPYKSQVHCRLPLEPSRHGQSALERIDGGASEQITGSQVRSLGDALRKMHRESPCPDIYHVPRWLTGKVFD